MSRPTPWQSFIGNPFLCIPLMLGAIYIGYLWIAGQAPWWIALFALIGASGVAKAAQRVRAYSAWERDWNNAGGAPRTFRPPSGKAVKCAIGIAIWGWFASMSQNVESNPAMDLAVIAFWVGTALMVFAAVVRAIRGPSAPKAGRTAVVTICLPPMRQSDSALDASSAIPRYCLNLLDPDYHP